MNECMCMERKVPEDDVCVCAYVCVCACTCTHTRMCVLQETEVDRLRGAKKQTDRVRDRERNMESGAHTKQYRQRLT